MSENARNLVVRRVNSSDKSVLDIVEKGLGPPPVNRT